VRPCERGGQFVGLSSKRELRIMCNNRGLWCASWRGEKGVSSFLKRSAGSVSGLVMVSLKCSWAR